MIRSKRGQESGPVPMHLAIRWLLLLILVALIIFGLVTKNLQPAFEKVKTKFNEVLLLLGMVHSDSSPGCNNDLVDKNFNHANKENAISEIEVCRDSCSYKLKNSEDYLGYNDFRITSAGARVLLPNGVYYPMRSIVDGYWVGMNFDEAEEERQIYSQLSDFMNEFYSSSGAELSMEDYFAQMDFSPEGYLTIIIEKGNKDIIFSYDGEHDDMWKRFVYNGPSEMVDEAYVYNEIYEEYSDGASVSWNYNGEDVRNKLGGNEDADFFDKPINRNDLEVYLVDKMNLTDTTDVKKYRIEIHDKLWNTVYTYENKKWHSNGLFTPRKELNQVIDGVMSGNSKHYRITWGFDGESDDYNIMIDTNATDVLLEKPSFYAWLYARQDEYAENMEEYESFIDELWDFVYEKYITVNDEEYEIEFFELMEEDRPFVGIDYNGAYYGMERSGDSFLLYVYPYKEKIGGWVYLDDEEYEDLMKIDEIYTYLYEKCGRRF